jgi:hypothetical protein
MEEKSTESRVGGEVFWNVTPSQAAATAQAGPTAYKDGLRWAYKRRPRAWWASRGLSGSMERTCDMRVFPVQRRGEFQGCKALLLDMRGREVQGNSM